ncbi:uncharacterized protein Dwil_GK28306 [Drosophila willistoni]|uniref:MD-2-related lipid-recognition domain-containing protein n=1 Tax=Drosophila willistoni TaxID=7260 RepID=A0A0Q9WZB8_DROWI|nr:uncharacterized protein Dwil_GK28306 [Drosophila willistoni]
MRLVFLVFFAFGLTKINAKFEFKNAKCTSLDKSFLEFDGCYLKSVNRTYKYITVKTKIFKLPLKSLSVNIELFKRLNGYKPFLFNFTVDACRFLANHRNSFNQYFYDLIGPYSNVNHSCPINHDIIVDKLPIAYLNHMVTTVLPMPEGTYCMHSVWSANGKERVDMNIFFSIE